MQKWMFLILLSVSSSLLAQGPPTITGLSPTSGSPGTMVTITGTNFISDPFRVEEVKFNTDQSGAGGFSATNFTVDSPTQLTVEVIPHSGDPITGYVSVIIPAGPTAGTGVSPVQFTITSDSATPSVAPKVTLTGDLPDSTAASPNAQCLNSGNDPSTSTAGVYDYGQCDDSLDADSINFYYQGPVELTGSTSDECTVRVFNDMGLLRVTFDSTTDCTVAVTATRESAPPPPRASTCTASTCTRARASPVGTCHPCAHIAVLCLVHIGCFIGRCRRSSIQQIKIVAVDPEKSPASLGFFF